MLGMTKQGVNVMIQRGDLPARRVGRQFVVRAEAAAAIAATGEGEHEQRQ